MRDALAMEKGDDEERDEKDRFESGSSLPKNIK
jgi:hypothetical protein